MDQAEEYVKRILKVMVYIEDNIDEDLTMEKLAKVACYSSFHFQRIFHAVASETVHAYVKRLRMERAAGRLRYTDLPVTEIALDASYNTPSAFTKAFKQSMGASPKSYRAQVRTLTQKLKDLSMIKPDKIEKAFPDLDLLFIRRYGSYKESPWSAWNAMMEFLHEHHLDLTKIRFFGISHDDPELTSDDKLRYDAAILAPINVKDTGELGRQVLKGGKVAIFTHNGSYEGIEETFNRILLKWLPDSKETFDETRPLFCEHFNMEYAESNPEKLMTKICVPLV